MIIHAGQSSMGGLSALARCGQRLGEGHGVSFTNGPGGITCPACRGQLEKAQAERAKGQGTP